MIVIDRRQTTEDGQILIPPFHTGHLGLIPRILSSSVDLPNTEVHVSLVSNKVHTTAPSDCEVVFSPYPPMLNGMMQLSCTMKDEPGVVSRLIDAVSGLGLNIATLQTSTVNTLDHHFVNMILDWVTTQDEASAQSSPSVWYNFQHYRELLPIWEERYVRLFVSIVARCGNVLAWEEVAGKRLPRLRIKPFEYVQQYDVLDRATISRADKPYHVNVKCPPKILTRLRSRLQQKIGAMTYVLLSDTEDGTLRAFFPSPDRVSKLIHLGFLHDDEPGALQALTEMVAKAQFNVVTSLLRKQTFARSAWEVLLEYRGSGQIPTAPESDIYRWACEQFLAGITFDLSERLLQFHIQLGPPSYPRPVKDQANYISFGMEIKTAPADVAKSLRESVDSRKFDHQTNAKIDEQLVHMNSSRVSVADPEYKINQECQEICHFQQTNNIPFIPERRGYPRAPLR